MYFDPHVKERSVDFFNFVMLQDELKKALEDPHVPLIAISGLRRTGKTSLIRVVLNRLKKKYVWIDGRDISSRDDIYRRIAEELQKYKRLHLEKIGLKGVEIRFAAKPHLTFMNKRSILLVVDEAQLLKSIQLDRILAFIYDTYPRIKLVLSGSEAGMLMSLLGKHSAKAPLYGRAILELSSHRLDKENAYRFLREGAAQAGKQFADEEIHATIASLGGIIGWLTKYGWYRLRCSHREALKKTVEEGAQVVKEEFQRFATRAEGRYTAIIKALKAGATWDEVKQQVATSDKQLAAMLKRLVDYGFVERDDRIYRIADPLLEAAF